MEGNRQGVLNKNFIVNSKYTVLFLIKIGGTAETYRVKASDGHIYFLKLFNYPKLHHSSFDSDNTLLEAKILKSISHPNIVAYKDSGELIYEGKRFFYLVTDFISGETLAAKFLRESILSLYDIKQIATGILNALSYLHSLPEPIIHNEITLQNVMLDLSDDLFMTKIIDFGYARYYYQSTSSYNKEGLDLQYVSSECFNNLFSPQSDLFSVGVIIYQLLFGLPPWHKDITQYTSSKADLENIILEERKKPLLFPQISDEIIDFDDVILRIIKKAIHPNIEIRFQNAKEFMQALNGEIIVEEINTFDQPKNETKKEIIDSAQGKTLLTKKGRGFSAIAGMGNLKDQLKSDVINVIENPEEYKKHNIGLPNGMLLYGPPGCGKTFFAERFAEETGYNYIKVVASDIASIYVHGTQEKIAKLFKQAKESAPTILYFDELDAMVPKREKVNTQSQSGEVNEFLSQLDNIGDSGVFVIGSTNKPDSIDSAVLRAGRLEKWFYIPPPDFDARKAMFELYLKDRPIDFGIDYKKLATLTQNYMSSDIKLLIDEASRKTIRDKTKRITMETLEFIIKNQKPTVSQSELKKYESIRKKIEEDIEEDPNDQRTQIGFKKYN